MHGRAVIDIEGEKAFKRQRRERGLDMNGQLLGKSAHGGKIGTPCPSKTQCIGHASCLHLPAESASQLNYVGAIPRVTPDLKIFSGDLGSGMMRQGERVVSRFRPLK